MVTSDVRMCAPNNVLALRGNVLTIDASDQKPRIGELCEVNWGDGGKSHGRVISFQGGATDVQLFAGTLGVARNATVAFQGRPQQLTFTQNAVGRIFDGAGVPIDGGVELTGVPTRIGKPSFNPIRREMPSQFIETGIPMIDICNSLAGSQKIPIFTSQGEPYNDLLLRIANQTSADVIILSCMGMTPAEFDRIHGLMKQEGSLTKTVVFAHTTDRPTAECLMCPDMALAMAESYATVHNKNVLVLLTDMTAFCDALKAVEADLKKIPAERGYPGNLYTKLAQRYEKAVDLAGRGSITIIGVSTMPGGDVTHPVPDNTGYITEGQFYLAKGVIDPFRSLSRLKQQVNKDTRGDHRSVMNALVRLYAEARSAREKDSMGHALSTFDGKLLRFADAMEAELMDLSVSMPLLSALDTSWRILKANFSRTEVPIERKVLDEYWSM